MTAVKSGKQLFLDRSESIHFGSCTLSAARSWTIHESQARGS